MTHSFPTRRCSDLGSRAGRHLGGRGRRRRPLTRPGEATEWSVLDAGGENRGMPSPQVSLVVTDLDGTLWHHDDHIDPEVVAAIGKLEDLGVPLLVATGRRLRSKEHTSELQSLMRISYAVFCLKKQKKKET